MTTRIGFVATGKAFLPELPAYRDFLNGINGFEADVVGPQSVESMSDPYDLLWLFPGLVRRNPGSPTIHEYPSLSTGRFPRIKDQLKRKLNPAPAGRVFLNPFVASGLGFDDEVPFILRDMGVADSFFVQRSVRPSFDFIYAGSLSGARGSCRMLDFFSRTSFSLGIVGSAPERYRKAYASNKNISFIGEVQNKDVGAVLAEARFGLGYTPNQYPYNHQTSTKVLEYLAAGLGVVVNRTPWVSRFMNETGAQMMVVRDDLADLTEERLEAEVFSSPDMNRFRWSNVFASAGLVAFIDRIVG